VPLAFIGNSAVVHENQGAIQPVVFLTFQCGALLCLTCLTGRAVEESDRHLGKSIVTHWLTLCRSPAGTMAGSRQKNAAGVKYSRGACPNIAARKYLATRHHLRAAAAACEACDSRARPGKFQLANRTRTSGVPGVMAGHLDKKSETRQGSRMGFGPFRVKANLARQILRLRRQRWRSCAASSHPIAPRIIGR
jgi:hypothetical protein